MILSLESKELKPIDVKITSSDSLIELSTDVDAEYIGVLLLSNGSNKVMNFTKKKDLNYQARLVITEDEIVYLKGSKFHIVAIDGLMKQQSNIIILKFDLELIKKDIKLKVSDEIEQLNIKVKSLSSVIDSLVSSKVLKDLKIQNTEYIKAGMIPVAIDSNGNCVMMYPFSNHIIEVNGQKAANGIVVLDSSMIEYKLGKNIKASLEDHADAISKLADAVTELSNELKDVRRHLDNVDIKLEQHINNGIV